MHMASSNVPRRGSLSLSWQASFSCVGTQGQITTFEVLGFFFPHEYPIEHL